MQTRTLAKVIQNLSETKLQRLTDRNQTKPSPVELAPLLGPCYYTNYILGESPSTYVGPAGTQAFINLDGFRWLQGTQSQNRIGKYIYLKRTTMNLQIQMDPLSRHGETKFRVIVYKSKRNAVIGTGGGNPMDNLFITHTGSTVGINNVAPIEARSMNFQTWLVNKRNYHIVKDFKFILAPQNIAAQGSTDPFTINQSNKPSEKNMTFSLGHYKKTDMSEDNTPTGLKLPILCNYYSYAYS